MVVVSMALQNADMSRINRLVITAKIWYYHYIQDRFSDYTIQT